MYWGDFMFLHEISIKKSTSRMAVGSPKVHWAGFGAFVEVLLPLDISNLLLLAKQLRKSHFFPKKLLEMAAAEPARDSGFLVMLGHGWDYELFYFMPFVQGEGTRI